MRKFPFLNLLAACLLAIGAHAEVPADAVWIDVRTPTEYAQGHLPQASNIPFDGIVVGVAGLKLPKDSPIYLYCASGGRAGKARQSLMDDGYTNVTNAGGLEDAKKMTGEASP